MLLKIKEMATVLVIIIKVILIKVNPEIKVHRKLKVYINPVATA